MDPQSSHGGVWLQNETVFPKPIFRPHTLLDLTTPFSFLIWEDLRGNTLWDSIATKDRAVLL